MNPTPELSRSEIIRASAGAGKTYVLVRRYLTLIFNGISPREILASTFTVKAAGEIRERIIATLAEAVLIDTARERLAAELGREISPADAERVFTSTLQALPGAAVCTLDALVARIAGGLTAECGLPLGWHLSESAKLPAELEQELVALQSRELGALLAIIVRSEATRKIAEPLVQVCLKFHELLRLHGADAFRIGAARNVSTPSASWVRSLKEISPPVTKDGKVRVHFKNGLDRLISQLSVDDTRGLFTMKMIQAALESGSFDREDLSKPHLEAILGVARYLRDLEWNRLVTRNEVLLMVLAHYDELYNDHQLRTGALQHADLLNGVARFMAEDTLEQVAFALDQRFSHVLLDEFQDTSPLQWRVLQPLVREIVGDETRERSVFIVGDPKQAIYGWRGGSAEIFNAITAEVPGTWVERDLTHSYRSSAVVIGFVNSVFSSLSSLRPEFDSVTREFKGRFVTHQTVKQIPGRVTITVGARDEGAEQDDLRWILERVQATMGAGRRGSIGILTRRNDTVVRIVQFLRTAGFTVVGDGRAGSARTLPVEAAKAFLHLCDHPADSSAEFFVSRSGLLGPEGTLPRGWAVTPGATLLRLLGYWRATAELSQEQINDLELANAALAGGIERGSSASELKNLLQNQPLSGGVGEISVMTIHRAKGLEFDTVLLPELSEKFIRSVSPKTMNWAENGSVKTMPFIGEALRSIDPRFVAADEAMQRAEYGEALCLLYVALTRAVSELHLYGAVASSKSDTPAPYSMFGLIAASLNVPLNAPGIVFDTGKS